jgi:hypothetical protein
MVLLRCSFGVKKHWQKRIVRSGPNTVCIFAENPPVREIAAGDTVFLDLGPVFDEWEADVGRTYVMGDDPVRRRLCQDLPRIFDALKQYFDDHRDVTDAQLYAYAQQRAEAAGWLFGGAIAGHIVGEFPHARIPGDKDLYRISPANLGRMRDLDALGQMRHWIIEVRLIDRARTFGGFYERFCNQRTWSRLDRVERRGQPGTDDQRRAPIFPDASDLLRGGQQRRHTGCIDRCPQLRGSDWQVRHPQPTSAANCIGNRCHRRNDRHLAHTARTKRMARVRHLDENRLDHRQVRSDGAAVIEEARIIHPPMLS